MHACNEPRTQITGWPATFLTLADIFLGVVGVFPVTHDNGSDYNGLSRLAKTLWRLRSVMYPCEVDGYVKPTTCTIVRSRGARLQNDTSARFLTLVEIFLGVIAFFA